MVAKMMLWIVELLVLVLIFEAWCDGPGFRRPAMYIMSVMADMTIA
jgi:hypothetical protein